ncbi:MAG: hypothetical protein IT208_15545 [Chthonomonadales bacterium]|nr:hypothetical protein [Chthonomonadales bacterium]
MFADVCGVLASGPAYVGALCDFLAGPPSAIAAEVATGDDGTLYPPTHLRVQAAPHGAGHGEEVARRRAEWLTLYPVHAMEAHELGAPGVASALAAGPYPSLGGCAVGEVLAFTTDDHAHAATCAADALAGMRPRYQGPAYSARPRGWRSRRTRPPTPRAPESRSVGHRRSSSRASWTLAPRVSARASCPSARRSWQRWTPAT